MNTILNYLNKNNRVKFHTYLLDATPLDVDYNFNSKKISKKNLESLAEKSKIFSYVNTKKYYIKNIDLKIT